MGMYWILDLFLNNQIDASTKAAHKRLKKRIVAEMRRSWNDSQKERLEIERIRAEQKMKSRVLEAEATALIKADDLRRKALLEAEATMILKNDELSRKAAELRQRALVEENLYLDAGDE
jgi:hypothetical protein